MLGATWLLTKKFLGFGCWFFLQFCATLARLVDLLASLTRKNILWLFRSRARRCIKSAHSDWLLMNLSWLVYSCCVCSGHDAGLWHFENHNHALTRTHEWTPTPTYSLMYADTHNMNTAYHTHTSFTHTSHTHTHKLTHTHTTHIHHLHTYIHINSPTIAFPSLSYFLFPCSITHSLTHIHSHSLTCACAHIHTYTKIHPPSPLHHSYTSSPLLAFLCSV